MIEQSGIEIARIFSSIIVLGIASFIDYKKRFVPDMLWIISSFVILFFIFYDQSLGVTDYLFSLFIAPLAILFWRMGLFGGADAFALITVALLAPFASMTGNTITPFTLLTNTILLVFVVLLVNFSRNMISLFNKNNIFVGFQDSKIRKIIAMFLGYWSKNPRFGIKMELYKTTGKEFEFSLHNAENIEFTNEQNVWVTPGIPFLTLIFSAFIMQIVFGDILLRWFFS